MQHDEILHQLQEIDDFFHQNEAAEGNGETYLLRAILNIQVLKRSRIQNGNNNKVNRVRGLLKGNNSEDYQIDGFKMPDIKTTRKPKSVPVGKKEVDPVVQEF